MSDDSPVRVPHTLEQLQEQWTRLMSLYVVHVSYAHASFDSLVKRYSQEGRYYHTIEHIGRVLSAIEDLAAVPTSAPEDLAVVELAGFFHDIVYDPGAPGNEERSADLAGTWLDGLGVPPEVVEETQRLILLTAEHEASPEDRNGSVLLDADLAILGADPLVYERYLEDLRRENSSMSERDYCARRRRVLEELLGREHIYRTPLCRNTLEPAARVNLTRELDHLGRSESDDVAATGGPAPVDTETAISSPPEFSEPLWAVAVAKEEDHEDLQDSPLEIDRAKPHLADFYSHLRAIALVVLALLVVIYVAVQLLRPLPSLELRVVPTAFRVPGQAALPWPDQGEAQVDIEGLGSLGGVGIDTPAPVASLTKIMTALVVLDDHPLASGASGPLLTVTLQDVTDYQADLAGQQSVVQVSAGEQLSEFQALEAMLVGSGNNIAQMLADWDAGSTSAFVAKMNDKAKSLSLEHTHYVDPIGIRGEDVSSASDEIRLSETALDNPVFAQIVAEPQVTLPVAGTLYNYDYDLGRDGIVGVKTGSSTAAGGCFVFLAREPIAEREVSVVGAVLGQQGQSPLTSALDVSDALVRAAFSSLKVTTLLHEGEVVGRVVSPWGVSARVVAGRFVNMLAAPGMDAKMQLLRSSFGRSLRSGTHVGRVVVRVGTESFTVPAVVSGNIGAPSITWRLTRV